MFLQVQILLIFAILCTTQIQICAGDFIDPHRRKWQIMTIVCLALAGISFVLDTIVILSKL